MLIFLNLALLIVYLLFNESTLRDIVGFFYLAQFTLMVYSYLKRNRSLLSLLRPSMLILAYTTLSFGLGALYLNNGHGFLERFIHIYENINHFKGVNFIILLFNFLIYITSYLIKLPSQRYGNIVLKNKTIFISVLIFVFFSFYSFRLDFLGGSGSFSYIPKLTALIFISIYLANKKSRWRYLFYFICLVLFAATNYESKREIIFVLIMFLIVDNLWNPFQVRLNVKSLAQSLSLVFVFGFMILLASVLRGYGEYETNNLIQTGAAVFQYMGSDIFIDAIGQNFEINYSYGNAIKAIDLYLNDNHTPLYGLTFIKAFFIFLPRSIFGYKPPSMIETYTPYVTSMSIESQPVHYYAELLWNFGVFSVFLIIVSIILFDKFYVNLINYVNYKKDKIVFIVCYIFLYSTLIQFVRGAGIDLYIMYFLISIPFIYLLVFINKSKKIYISGIFSNKVSTERCP